MKESLRNLFKKDLKDAPDWFWIGLIIIIPIALLYRILFTYEVVRASDIVSQYMWGILDFGKSFPNPLKDLWGPYVNFGNNNTVGTASTLLPDRFLVYMLFPFPSNMAWEVVLHLIFAGIGTFVYCRIIGLSRFTSFLASLFFMLSSELVTLINAGHFQKLNTISLTPWILSALEKGLQERRPFFFLITGGALAIQFIEMHWQISFYTCLAVGFYFIFRVLSLYFKDRDLKEISKLIIYAVLMVCLFFSAASIAFLPVYSWSKTTERAGGMAFEDGMSWSMPPEELVTYLIPGFFGLSRQESGPDPGYIDIYYWGRMVFTQTTDYMGVLPLVMAVVALLYRRNWYTWVFLLLAVLAMIVALGKYTPIYRFMYYYLPAFSTFRVPKMILFLFAFAGSIIAGFGAEWLFFDEEEMKAKRVKNLLTGLFITLIVTAVITLFAYLNMEGLIQAYRSDLSRAFRWKLPPDIAFQRFMNIIYGSITFMVILSIAMLLIWQSSKKCISKSWIMILATMLFIVDVWNVNGRFIVTGVPPTTDKSEIVKFLEKDKSFFRVAVFGGESAFLLSRYNIPIVSNYLAVSEKDFAEYREHLDLDNNLLDLMNVKYVTLNKSDIGDLSVGTPIGKYRVAFNGDPNSILIQSNTYLPRVYPVHQVVIERNKDMIFNILNHPKFNPGEMVVLADVPPAPLNHFLPSSASRTDITRYSNDKITIQADMAQDGVLVLSEKYYPGWKAYVDGKETKIYKANYIMRAVYLPMGTHKVEFIFDPWPYKVGLWVSSATFLFLIGVVVWRVRENKAEV